MNFDSAEDRAFCLAGLTRFRDRFQTVLELLPPHGRNRLATIVDELSSMDEEQLKAQWNKFGAETYECGDEFAKRQLGVAVDELPTLLRDWMLSRRTASTGTGDVRHSPPESRGEV
jgi:hypothetical protein